MRQPLGVSADRLTMTNQDQATRGAAASPPPPQPAQGGQGGQGGGGQGGGGGGGGAGGVKLSQLAVGCMRRVEFTGCLLEGHVLSELLELTPLETLRCAQRELTCSSP